MSYIKADEILPKELLEAIQQYVDGQLIYIPCKEKQEWGSGTNAKIFFRERNERIYRTFQRGSNLKELSRAFSLSEKSIQRILHDQRLALATDSDFH
ncbi:MAG: hypothetical protein IJ195_06055 [Lachnospiraceae bacterium]|nr:hypothetical protein [Lachnospiraceae bacterium]